MPKVSVFIPVYNGGKFIAKTLEAVLQQTFQDFEIIVVNDGSTDNTLDVLATFDDDRIKIFSNFENKGLTFTRNRGLELANGEYLAINDCDDISHPNRLRTQVDFLDKNKSVGIVGTSARRIVNGQFKYIWSYVTSFEGIKCRLFWGNAIINPTAMFRMDYIKANNLRYDDRFSAGEDYDLFERAVHLFEVRNLSDVLLDYNIHGQNATITMSKVMHEKANEIGIRQLTKLGLQLSERENILHKRILNYEFNNNEYDLKELEFHLRNIVDANMSAKNYKVDIFNSQIGERWFQLCYHSKVNKRRNIFYSSSLSELHLMTSKEAFKFYIKDRFFN
ncbi:glycosyltransferase family 2 protein [Pontibacter sp. E15-1]|uniref:glycosyltransferase family 2 protein n=1 Tax=Pontibacter sp. E15-1 TaxID=2919918 RepID=UPI001F4F7E43|nr:glycosyltransferase family A protein [Pontibacter sp. E15-1]MCJ8166336.1 glycosyltransferase family 2 protein [Pontibacter sp. E15-1]